MAIPISELQSINPSSIIELFKLELVEGLHYATGNPDSVPTVFRFHSGTNMNSNGNIVWQGDSYERFPITADGFAFETKDYWVEVKKEKLQDWIHEKCVDKVMGWNVYELSSRPGAKDLFTKVPTIDLCYIGKIKKKA